MVLVSLSSELLHVYNKFNNNMLCCILIITIFFLSHILSLVLWKKKIGLFLKLCITHFHIVLSVKSFGIVQITLSKTK